LPVLFPLCCIFPMPVLFFWSVFRYFSFLVRFNAL
jgi:hypothetical protein